MMCMYFIEYFVIGLMLANLIRFELTEVAKRKAIAELPESLLGSGNGSDTLTVNWRDTLTWSCLLLIEMGIPEAGWRWQLWTGLAITGQLGHSKTRQRHHHIFLATTGRKHN